MGSHNKQRHSYKRGIDFEGSRKKRQNDGISLRKQRRHQGIQKKRAIFSQPTPLNSSTYLNTAPVGEEDWSINDSSHSLSQSMFSTSNSSQNVRLPQFISDSNVKISETIVQLLMKSNFINTSTSVHVDYRVDIQTENIKDAVMNSGIVPLLVNHLQSDSQEVREQSALCLGNIAGEMSELRDHVIQCGAISPILENILHTSNDNFREKIVWSLSNLCRGKQTPEMNRMIPAFPTLINLLNSTHSETLLNACWGLVFLTEENDTIVQNLVEQNLTSQFLSFLRHEDPKIVLVALRILGNFIHSGHLEHMIDSGLMSYVSSLLDNPDTSVRSETCYVLSIVADHGTRYIDYLVNLSAEMRRVIDIAQNSPFEERTEAIWVIFNIANKGSDMHLKILVDFGALSSLCQNLQIHDIKIILLVLESIENILLVGERMALRYEDRLEECGGRQKLEGLLSHNSDDVYHKTNLIIQQFFEDDDSFKDDFVGENWYGWTDEQSS